MTAAVATPLLGAFLYKVGKSQYPNLLFLAVCLVAYVHLQYAYWPQCAEDCEYTIPPMVLFGIGHSLLVTMQAPIVQQLFSQRNEKQQKAKDGVLQSKDEGMHQAFAYLKVAENLGAMLVTYLAGVLHDRYIYMKAGFYSVSLLLASVSLAATGLAFYYKMQKSSQEEKESS